MNAVTTMKDVLATIDDTSPTQPDYKRMITRIEALGIEPDVNVGNSTITGEETAKWWLGQMLSIHRSGSFWAMNSLINWGHDHIAGIEGEAATEAAA